MCPQSSRGDDIAPDPPGVICLRAATDGDREFLFELYNTTRAQELEAWGWAPAQCDAFLKMQFDAQAHSIPQPNIPSSCAMTFPSGV